MVSETSTSKRELLAKLLAVEIDVGVASRLVQGHAAGVLASDLGQRFVRAAMCRVEGVHKGTARRGVANGVHATHNGVAGTGACRGASVGTGRPRGAGQARLKVLARKGTSQLTAHRSVRGWQGGHEAGECSHGVQRFDPFSVVGSGGGECGKMYPVSALWVAWLAVG
jgi:hypothetical protein